jgi:hypothetical protein
MPDAVRVPQAGIVPQTSFRFRLATDTLVLGLHLVVTYPCRGLSPPYEAPCPAHTEKGLSQKGGPIFKVKKEVPRHLSCCKLML